MAAPLPETDAELVERARAGDRAAFALLVERYQGRVYRLAVRLAGSPDRAQEVLQETFLQVFRKLDTFRAESAFSSWLCRIAVNAALMNVRRDRSQPTGISLDELPHRVLEGPDWTEQADAPAERHEAARVLKEAVDELPEKFRAVFLLREIEGLSVDEVAEVLELTVGSVKARLHQARLFLRDRLSRYFKDRQ